MSKNETEQPVLPNDGDEHNDDRDNSPDDSQEDASGGAQDEDTDGQDDADDGQDDRREHEKNRGRRDGRGQRQGDDKTARTIAAIREDFKDERGKRQAAEKTTTALQKQLDEMQAAQAKQMDALAKAMGLKTDDEPPSPEQVATDFGEKLKAAQTEIETERKRGDEREAAWRDASIQLAVYLGADDHDANAKALLDSASFLKKVAGLDPADANFTDQIGEAIAAAVERNDRLRKPRKAADRSGGEMNTGGKPARRRPASMSEAITKHYAR
jgi:hypothetical protein